MAAVYGLIVMTWSETAALFSCALLLMGKMEAFDLYVYLFLFLSLQLQPFGFKLLCFPEPCFDTLGMGDF